MKEAMLYEIRDGDAVCHLCAHRCRVGDGARGKCGVRLNQGGKLYSLVYGKLIAHGVDPIEKKPLYHFLPGTGSFSIATAGCNFFCDFCQNWQISQMSHDGGQIYGEDFTPQAVVAEARSAGCSSIAYTYTEPTIFFEFAYDCGVLAHEAGLKNVFVTNGYQTPEAVERMTGVVDAANVDLKSFSDDFYGDRCGARLAPVLKAIELMHGAGIFLELTTLLIPGENDSEDEIESMAGFIASVSPDIPWHISRFHPQYKQTGKEWTPVGTIMGAVEIGKRAGLKYIYPGNLPAGDLEHTYCPGCGQKAVERAGFASRNVGMDGRKCSACGEDLNFVIE